MIILVSDTSVLIDLERGGLLEPAFSCGLTMVVPDLLYERELEADNGPLLRRLGLGVVALVPDCFALTCARRPDHALVTGDKLLRTEALSRQCTVYGLLWILDQMESSASVGTTLLHEGLTRLSNHPRSRLPAGEVRARLQRWSPT
jgi:hypothetical protein